MPRRARSIRDAYPGHVLITGASGGIGEALARAFASRGCNLVLVSRSARKLSLLARTLAETYCIEALACPADLASAEGPEVVYGFCRDRGLGIGILINGAGFSCIAPFSSMPFGRMQEMVGLNLSAPMHLSRLFLPDMLQRRSGAIVQIASMAGLQGVAGMAPYSATKSFLITLAEALHIELRGTGVRAFAVCPGFVRTGFLDTAGHDPSGILLPIEAPGHVVRSVLRGLACRRPRLYPAMLDRMLALAQGLVPRSWTLSLAAFLAGAWRQARGMS